jgi:hypothetical protein
MGINRRAARTALLALGLLGFGRAEARAALGEVMTTPVESKSAALKESMRVVWAEHVIWTRAYVVAAVAGGPDAHDAADRLLRNQADIAEVFAPYYGKETAAKLAALLRQHILVAADVVDAAKIGDDARFREADKRWHDNAEDIAGFFAGVNPSWSRKEMLDMFNDHLALTTKEATSRLQKKWPDDIAAFDEIFRQMMLMADELSNGLIKQFPDKF